MLTLRLAVSKSIAILNKPPSEAVFYYPNKSSFHQEAVFVSPRPPAIGARPDRGKCREFQGTAAHADSARCRILIRLGQTRMAIYEIGEHRVRDSAAWAQTTVNTLRTLKQGDSEGGLTGA